MGSTARRAAVVTLVSGSIVVGALALWKIKVVIALLFLGFIVSAAMRPGIDWLQLHARMPRGAGLLLHYLVLACIVGVVLWLFVPRAIDQVQQASSITSPSQLHRQAKNSTGIKHDILTGLDKRLRRLPSCLCLPVHICRRLAHPAPAMRVPSSSRRSQAAWLLWSALR